MCAVFYTFLYKFVISKQIKFRNEGDSGFSVGKPERIRRRDTKQIEIN